MLNLDSVKAVTILGLGALVWVWYLFDGKLEKETIQVDGWYIFDNFILSTTLKM